VVEKDCPEVQVFRGGTWPYGSCSRRAFSGVQEYLWDCGGSLPITQSTWSASLSAHALHPRTKKAARCRAALERMPPVSWGERMQF